MIDTIVQAMTSFISAILVKGSEETGKRIAGDVYEKVKKIFRNDKQKEVLLKLEKQPVSRQYQEEFENELLDMLSKGKSFSKEMVYILTLMSVNAVILENMYKLYIKTKFDYDLACIMWNESADGTDEELLLKIKKLEVKLYSLNEKTINLLNLRRD